MLYTYQKAALGIMNIDLFLFPIQRIFQMSGEKILQTHHLTLEYTLAPAWPLGSGTHLFLIFLLWFNSVSGQFLP